MQGEKHWLSQILSQDSELAREWLFGYLSRKERTFFKDHYTSRTAVQALNRADRQTVLHRLPEDFWDVELAAALVGNDLNLFRELLTTETPTWIQLAPLAGKPTEEWIEKAKLALEAGFTAEQIVSAAYGHVWGRSGKLSDGYEVWKEAFQPFVAHADERIREIGNIGTARAEQERDRALQREHAEEVRGL